MGKKVVSFKDKVVSFKDKVVSFNVKVVSFVLKSNQELLKVMIKANKENIAARDIRLLFFEKLFKFFSFSIIY